MVARKQTRQPEIPHSIEWVPIGECEVIYRDAQRANVNERTIKDIVDAFDPDAFGIPVVAQINGRGRYHIIDGQNRHTALKRMGWGQHQLVEVEVIRVKDKAEAARLFLLRNHFRAPSAVDRFIVSVTAGEFDESAANALVESLGFCIGNRPSATTISAVTHLMRSYRKYGADALATTLATIPQTWRSDPDRTRGEIISAWTRLFGDHGAEIDPKRLASRIAKKYTAASLVGAARGAKNMFGGSVDHCVLRVTVAQYNVGLRTSARIELES